MKKNWIDGKTILLTGASSGIGRELCKLLILKNNCVVFGVGRSKEKFEKLKEELGEKQANLNCITMDVSQENNWIDLAENLKDKNIDVLINNAGILPSFESFDNLCNRVENKKLGEEINNTMNVNFLATVYSCGYFSRILENSSTPAIINIASSSALCPLPGISIYSASKSAVKNFTECLMLEKKYYVGLICPGFTKTEIFRYQSHNSNNKLINMIATNLDKMAFKIYKAILKKKRKCVFGFDAKCMDRLYRLAPKSSPKFFGKILKKSKIDLFKDVF